MLPYLHECKAILSLGGDNYSLDYGIPKVFTDLDDLVLKYKKPIIIWGASVGPFSQLPDYEKYMIEHLKKVTAIFVRESASFEYLQEKGLTNIYRVADPAFLMKPSVPLKKDNITTDFLKEAVGINFSPLMAKYITDGNQRKWTELAADIVERLSVCIKRPIILIPHVTSPHSNDYEFLKNVITLLKQSRNILLLSNDYDAAELKWIISQLRLFAGARTHATIAAFSSGVPTLSFSYSIKAVGLNKDIFGDVKYCLQPNELTVDNVLDKIQYMLVKNDDIRNELQEKLPNIQQMSLASAEYLQKIIR
jgi:polysaccharide pyruvyl transferase WcaK-like protein